MNNAEEITAKLAIFGAVSLQAIGKVAYGTWLIEVPVVLFVFVSFSMIALVFLCTSRHGQGAAALLTLFILNLATAITFLSFFFALKLIEPAIVGALQISIGPLVAVLIACVSAGQTPSRSNLIVCLVIFIGCLTLGASACSGTAPDSDQGSVSLGIAASLCAGLGAVAITVVSKSLLSKGWSFGAVLAHRFYIIVPLSLILWLGTDSGTVSWSFSLVVSLFFVALNSVLLPLYLLQVGISRCDTYTVMVMMSALPNLTFLVEGLSPRYDWSYPTAIGLLCISTAIVWELSSRKANRTP